MKQGSTQRLNVKSRHWQSGPFTPLQCPWASRSNKILYYFQTFRFPILNSNEQLILFAELTWDQWKRHFLCTAPLITIILPIRPKTDSYLPCRKSYLITFRFYQSYLMNGLQNHAQLYSQNCLPCTFIYSTLKTPPWTSNQKVASHLKWRAESSIKPVS